jgi:hypothetical protein
MTDSMTKAGAVLGILISCARPGCGTVVYLDRKRPSICHCGMVTKLSGNPEIPVEVTDASNAEPAPKLVVPGRGLIVPNTNLPQAIPPDDVRGRVARKLNERGRGVQ